ncbi:hypothetical protein ANO11243_012010 [Dothideomycetidae sp. 11243]|nr:hypothetical protein ANO11243_012010 [fungal sp. No.11243]
MAVKAFFPRRDVALALHSLSGASDSIGPVFDRESCSQPIDTYDAERLACTLPEALSCDGQPTVVPPVPKGFRNSQYLFPSLTRNEHVRLTTLWYHTRSALDDEDLLANLQVKVDLIREFLDWEIALCGILDNHTFTRLVTSGIPTAVVPRRESTCSHTVQNVAPGAVFQIPDMDKDWRFKGSPPVADGGLRSYAGTAVRCQVEDDETVALGSLCVASTIPGKSLSPSQQATLIRFADMLSSEIINRSRSLRREQQQCMSELLTAATSNSDIDQTELGIMSILKDVYPTATFSLQEIDARQSISLPHGRLVPLSEFKNGVWEDSLVIDALIASHNHDNLHSTTAVRALVGLMRVRPQAKALVVASPDVRYVFDDIDAWFVDRCSSVLSNVEQERSLMEARLAKDRFLRGITHQLRTPIHGVLGSVDLLVEDLAARDLLNPTHNEQSTKELTDGSSGDDQTSIGQILRTIQNSGRELMGTVNNVLRLNRWAELMGTIGTNSLHDLTTLDSDLYDDTRKMLPELEVERLCVYFDNQLPANTATTMLDTSLIKECLQSLMINSFQFSRRGCLVVATSSSEDCSSLFFDIKDNGRGIRPENQKRVFDEYEKEDVHSRGAGLGLTLASRIASVMSGTVEIVTSVPGAGSHFRLTFPNPQLGCRIDCPRTKRSEHSWKNLRTFSILFAGPVSHTTQHFAQHLQRSGLERITTHDANLNIVPFTSVRSMFIDCLRTAASLGSPSVCLVPAAENITRLHQLFPSVRFFQGPFTSRKIGDILADLDFATTSRLDSPVKSGIRSQRKADSASPDPWDLRMKNLTLDFPSTRHQSTPQVLLVDDNAINLRIIRMYCEKRRHPYRLGVDGLEAVTQYQAALEENAPISLILLDLQMPNCDGIEACAQIRKIEKERGLTPAAVFISKQTLFIHVQVQ